MMATLLASNTDVLSSNVPAKLSSSPLLETGATNPAASVASVTASAPPVERETQRVSPCLSPSASSPPQRTATVLHSENPSQWMMQQFQQMQELLFAKDLEIKLLNDKLNFSEKQIHERDMEIRHYQSVVSTLKDLVGHQSQQNRMQHHQQQQQYQQQQQNQRSRSLVKSNSASRVDANGLFENQNASNEKSISPSQGSNRLSRARKVVSFHNDVEVHFVQANC